MMGNEFIVIHKKRIAKAIMLLSLMAFFGVGVYFNLFGQKINFNQAPETYLFFSFILSGVFGAFYTRFSLKLSFVFSLFIGLVFLGLYIAGRLSRGEL